MGHFLISNGQKRPKLGKEVKRGQIGQITHLPGFFISFLKNSFGFDKKWIFIFKNGGLGHFLSHDGQKGPKMGKKVGFGQIGQSNLPRDKNSI